MVRSAPGARTRMTSGFWNSSALLGGAGNAASNALARRQPGRILDFAQCFLGKVRRADLGEVLLPLAVGADNHGDSFRVSRLRIIRGAIGHSNLAIGVAQQRVIEIVLARERGILRGRVEAHAQDGCVLLIELSLEVAEPATLHRSTWGIGFREKPEHERLTFVVPQRHCLSFVIFAGEIRSLIAGFEHGSFPHPRYNTRLETTERFVRCPCREGRALTRSTPKRRFGSSARAPVQTAMSAAPATWYRTPWLARTSLARPRRPRGTPSVLQTGRRARNPPSPSPEAFRECLIAPRSEEHTSELQSRQYLVCRLLLEKKNNPVEHLPAVTLPLSNLLPD